MVKCPYCGFEGEFKLLKTWKFKYYTVYYYECPNCGKLFRYYVGVSPRGKRAEFIIRVGIPRGQSRGGAK
jgi:uncharacterized Zn finger protein